jgi:formylglycine-generating enzyme required for sulfatase activity
MAESSTNGKGQDEDAEMRPPASRRSTITHESTPGDGAAPRGPAGDELDVLKRGATVGRYLVLERLGAGGMGVVYAAYDPELDRKVAIKLLRPSEGRGDPAKRQARLVREAKAMAKLSHANVGAIFDVGVHEGQVFLAIEYLPGGTLKSWLEAEKRPWREIVRMFIEVGNGLAAAHAEGLIHRDFKPDNVLLDKAGKPKVVDFGLVRLTAALDVTSTGSLDDADLPVAETAVPASSAIGAAVLTRTGALAGTPAYMAAEQFLGKAIDERTDQFAFCVALYEGLYGERPFDGDTMIALADAVTDGRVREAPRESSVPAWLRKTLLKGLAVEPATRFSSMSVLIPALTSDPVARRMRRLGLGAALLALFAVVFGLQRRSEQRRGEFERRIAARITDGTQAFGEALVIKDRLGRLRSQSFALFDIENRDAGERVWTDARAAAGSLDAAYERAQQALQAALAMDQARSEARRHLLEVLFERAILAEEEGRHEELTRHLASLETLDTAGAWRQKWRQPGSVSVQTDPAGAAVSVERFDTGGDSRLTAVAIASQLPSPVAGYPLPAGSYRLHIAMAGRADTLYPFVVKRGESLAVNVALPLRKEIPEGFRYVPSGTFLYGDRDEEWRLSFLNTVPLHERPSHAFLVEEHEATFAEWIAFVSSLSPRDRAAHLPMSTALHASVSLTQDANDEWRLRLNISGSVVQASSGEKIVYPGRPSAFPAQDWLKMPVVGISATDIRAYLRWLSSSGRVPGARFCRDSEWERVARGADERTYPGTSSKLPPGDANIDATYGRLPGAYGPDEVGRHPQSRSPFGVDDMAGNAWEFVQTDVGRDAFVIRGGSYYHPFMSARSTNREPIEIETRSYIVGFRVCADWPRTSSEGGTIH